MQIPSWMPFAKAKPKPIPPAGEISFRDSELYPGRPTWPYNPDVFIQKKGGMEVYDKMRRDEQVSACQSLKRLAVLCSGWQIEPASDEGQDKEAAEFVEDTFKRLRGTFEARIKDILTAMDYGFSVTEKIWGIQDEGEFKGKVVLAGLKTRKPHTWDFDADEYGNLRPMGLWQNNGEFKYDPRKFVVYSHNKEFDNWYGKSDLQAAYRSYWSKDNIVKFWNIFLEKFAMGIPILRPSEGKTLNDPLYTSLKDAIFNLQAFSALAWNVSGPEVDILESKRRGVGEYDKAIEFHDRGIGRALLMPVGLGFSEEGKGGGSYARSKKHFDMWLWLMADLRKTVEEAIVQEQIVAELVSYNYTVKQPPQFKFMPFEDEQTQQLAELWLKAIEGHAVNTDAEDEIHLRKILKFPDRDVDELQEIIDEKKALPPPPNPAAGPGPPGNLPPEQGDKNKGGNVIPIKPGTAGVGPASETMHESHFWHRDLTLYEKRVRFKTVEKALDGYEQRTRDGLREVLVKQRDRIIMTIDKAVAAKKINMGWINSLALQFGYEFQAIVKEFMRTSFEAGREDARREIARARGRKHEYVVKIPPKKSIQMLEQSAFWIRNVTFQTLTESIQGLLISALESGEAPGETLQKVRNAYDPYIGDEQVVRDQRQIEPYRIETMIRTNNTKAYNRGKLVEFADPELDGFVRAMQLSAILDTRTTDTCRSADGKIVMLDDPNAQRLVPPLHYNCRTILVPITTIDGQFEASRQEEIEHVKTLVPADFGGNTDKPPRRLPAETAVIE